MSKRTWVLSVLLAVLAASGAACGDDDGGGVTPGPYDSIEPSQTITAPGLSAPVDVVRDAFGVPHIHAKTEGDAAFANGYVVAHDRILQLDLMRHFAKGEVAELFGALDPGQIDGDIEMRMHRFTQRSEAQLALLVASSDPDDQAAVAYLTRYADGVNHYIDELKAGKHELDSAVATFVAPDTMKPWTPADSIAIGLLQTWSLSYDTTDLDLTEVMQRAQTAFDDSADPARQRRAGAYFDLQPFEPVFKSSTIDGFPNVGTDGGTRAKPARGSSSPRPEVPLGLLADARSTLRFKKVLGMQFRQHGDGSNNWVVGPALAGGKALLANDPHLSLSNPPIMHMIHITVEGGAELEGVSLAGVPGIVLGHNAHIAWGATTAYHDVTDFYLETIAPCTAGGGDCASFEGGEVPLETFEEVIKIGALGTITDSFTATYEVVPHHGPIIPKIANHRIAPRAAGEAISTRYTGHDTTKEMRAIYRLARADSLDKAFAAMDDYAHGAQNWVIIDDQGHFGWTSTARLPRRTSGCFTFHATTAPDGVAPFFVIPGDGSCEWGPDMDARYIPHAVDPAKGYLATANHDLTGESFDGDLLNGPVVDGVPLYAGGPYYFGMRESRITERLEALKASGETITLDDLASVQADTKSSWGTRLTPPLLDALDEAAEEIATPGTHPDLAAFVTTLTPAQKTRLAAARARLGSWTFETPAAVEGSPSAAEIRDSSAAALFNVYLVYFLDGAFGDELQLMGTGADYEFTAAAAFNALTDPAKLRTGLAVETGEPVLCDDLATAATVESCTLQQVMAVDAAMTFLEGQFGSADMDTWRWGRLHRLTLESLAPAAELNVPPSDDPDPLLREGFPRPGDAGSVDASQPGGLDLDFTYGHGPCIRHLVEITPGQAPVARLALPGGDIFDRGSAHYRDQVDTYWRKNLYFELPWTVAQVLEKAEERWLFKP